MLVPARAWWSLMHKSPALKTQRSPLLLQQTRHQYLPWPLCTPALCYSYSSCVGVSEVGINNTDFLFALSCPSLPHVYCAYLALTRAWIKAGTTPFQHSYYVTHWVVVTPISTILKAAIRIVTPYTAAVCVAYRIPAVTVDFATVTGSLALF